MALTVWNHVTYRSRDHWITGPVTAPLLRYISIIRRAVARGVLEGASTPQLHLAEPVLK